MASSVASHVCFPENYIFPRSIGAALNIPGHPQKPPARGRFRPRLDWSTKEMESVSTLMCPSSAAFQMVNGTDPFCVAVDVLVVEVSAVVGNSLNSAVSWRVFKKLWMRTEEILCAQVRRRTPTPRFTFSRLRHIFLTMISWQFQEPALKLQPGAHLPVRCPQ